MTNVKPTDSVSVTSTATQSRPPEGPTAVSTKTRLLRAIARSGAGASRPLAGRRLFSLWGIVNHVGRRSGTAYATPVVILRTAEGFMIPLPFGSTTQWPRNVIATGGCRIRWRGRDYDVANPTIIDWTAARPDCNVVLRHVVPLTGIRHFLRVRETGG